MDQRQTLALLVDFYGGEYQRGLIQGAEDATNRSDDHLIVVAGRWLNAPKSFDAIQSDIYHRLRHPGVNAVIAATGCLSHYVSSEQLAEFFASFAPLPVVSISVRLPGIPSIVVNNRIAQRQIVDHLIDVHHCRRLAYISGPPSSVEGAERLDGYVESLRNHGLEIDPRLILTGNFWSDTGHAAVEQLLERKIEFDAFVAANDYMALGALEACKTHGIRVPHDLSVVGFDDVPVARMAAPSLTTVRQPLLRMGALGVELVRQRLGGEPVADLYPLDVEIVRRQSCGCIQSAGDDRARSVAATSPCSSWVDNPSSRALLEASALQAIAVQGEQWPGIVRALVVAWCEERAGTPGAYVGALSSFAERFQTRANWLEQLFSITESLRSTLQTSFAEAPLGGEPFYSGMLVIAEWMQRFQMRSLYDQEQANGNLRASIERLSTAITPAGLRDALRAIVPTTAIRSSCLNLYDDPTSGKLRVFAATGVPDAELLHDRCFELPQLAPDGFFPKDRRYSFLLMPLTHGDKQYGQALFEVGEQYPVYSMLREQIGAALKVTDLHRTVVEETARRERAERERLERETEIAQQIQTAILPRHFDVPGLEIVAFMRPATSVGGDYYDVIPTTGGCLLGIGDVTGHGLLAGMIMLMVQSMVAAGVAMDDELHPRKIIAAVNRALYGNIRYRLQGNDHVTLTLIKYMRNGRLTFAGLHEDVIVWRSRTRRCEMISSPGFWTAALADVEHLTTELETQLEAGDQLVLYTDGITEAMNEAHEQFGSKRLADIVAKHGDDSPSELSAAVLRALADWTHVLIDDVSLVIARYASEELGV